ncbi:GNAT family N-acetyltransferase [Psychrobacillus sp. FSL W7-1493]|uniref:GNAT family N-acetyltransferase n=1 Tax=Psychrobacillus sp. FSL W7-1493 TaxID=2921552 RepID=UPI0030FA6B6E
MFDIDCGEILLREFSINDVDAIYELTSQPEVYEFLPDWRSTREQRANWVQNYEIPSNKSFLSAVPNIDEQDYLKLGIILKKTGKFIGFCNTGLKEGLPHPNREIAYAISKDYQKSGYATQAVKGLIHYLFTKTNVQQLNTVVLPYNYGSIRVIQKCGFSLKGNIQIDGKQHEHYVLSQRDWKRGQ